MVSLVVKLLLVLSFTSCSKLTYIYQQTSGQVKLLTRARDNNVVLKDVKIPQEFKQKIRQIVKYKHFFYTYFQLPEKNIYSKTYMLVQKAVTYLVISSPVDKIKAIEHCFPFVGCFPYLGFFDEQSATDYFQQQQAAGFAVWKRDVYAYSTLGYFNDPILSSFFYYDELPLAELVFHELFHTIFFIKGNVEVNENLANFFAQKLVEIYFKDNPKKLFKYKQRKKCNNHLYQAITLLGHQLQDKYQQSSQKPDIVLNKFLQDNFIPKIKEICATDRKCFCFPLQGEWNNARFAAFNTYEAKRSSLDNLFQRLKLDLRDFFHYLNEKQQIYLKHRGDFETYLFN